MTVDDEQIETAMEYAVEQLEPGENMTVSKYRYVREDWMPTARTIYGRFEAENHAWAAALEHFGFEEYADDLEPGEDCD